MVDPELSGTENKVRGVIKDIAIDAGVASGAALVEAALVKSLVLFLARKPMTRREFPKGFSKTLVNAAILCAPFTGFLSEPIKYSVNSKEQAVKSYLNRITPTSLSEFEGMFKISKSQ